MFLDVMSPPLAFKQFALPSEKIRKIIYFHFRLTRISYSCAAGILE